MDRRWSFANDAMFEGYEWYIFKFEGQTEISNIVEGVFLKII